MIGHVEDSSRSLLDFSVSKEASGNDQEVTTWIDTAFDGHLVFSSRLIADLELDTLVETEAILADGSKVTLETFLCYVEWFQNRIPVQVIANAGKLPLLGTELLDGHVLHIDYVQNTLSLT